MKRIEDIFDRMDTWRHLPSYQLERRADLFFAPYLPQVLERHLGFPINSRLIPEFPVHIPTVWPDRVGNKSCKIDYLALSTDRSKAVLVELKTDRASHRSTQDELMERARDAGLGSLLEGLKKILTTTKAKGKYVALLRQLEVLGLVQLPRDLVDSVRQGRIPNANKLAEEIEVVAPHPVTQLVYIMPSQVSATVISFEDFADVVESEGDPMSLRFARSLKEWSRILPGELGKLPESPET